MGLWSRKTLERCAEQACSEQQPRLQRSLGIVSLTAFGVGSTIGAGIFSLTGEVAARHTGPAISLAFLLASFACFLAGLCYAELATLVPISGSAYSYTYVAFGELPAWIVGWSLTLEWLFSISVVAVSWSGYTTAALHDVGIGLPPALIAAPLKLDPQGHLVFAGTWFDLPAMLVVLGCTLLLLIGTGASARINTAIVLAKVTALILFIVLGARLIQPGNWQPFIPANAGGFGQFGWSGVLQGAATVFFAYLGFDGVSTLAEDARDPQRTVPWSLFASLAVCTLVYVGVSLTVTGLVDYRQLAVPDPLYRALSASTAALSLFRYALALIAIVGLVSVILTCILGQVRIFFAMARDGLLPERFARLGGRNRTPRVATLVTGAGAALLAGVTPLEVLGELVSIGTLLAFAVVCIAVVAMRRIAPTAPRAFRIPWVPALPIAGALTCLGLMLTLPESTWIRLAVWTAVGLLIYATYGTRKSRRSDARPGSLERA